MPTLRKRTPTFDDPKVYVCIESFTAGALGATYPSFVRVGARLRGEFPARFPQFFVEDGADDDTVARAKTALFGSPARAVAAPVEPAAPRKQYRATRSFTVRVPIAIAGAPGLTTGQAGLRIIAEGDLLDGDDPLVRTHKDAFERVKS